MREITDPTQLKVLTDPLRTAILDLMMRECQRLWTAKELASVFGCKQTSIYYHIDLLDAFGLITVERVSVINGIAERHYRAAQRGICFHLGNCQHGSDE